MMKLLLEAILLFLVFFLPGILWPEAGLDLLESGLTEYMLRFLWIAVPQILLMLYIIDLSRDPPLEEFGVRGMSLLDLPRAVAIYAGLFALLLALSLSASLLPKGGERLFERGFRWSLQGPAQLPLAMLFSLATGYREELYFRAYLLTRLTRSGLSPPISILLSTLLFSAGHLYQGVAGLAVAAAQGGYFGFLFLRTRNLHMLALAHAFYNLTVLGLTLLPRSFLPPPGY